MGFLVRGSKKNDRGDIGSVTVFNALHRQVSRARSTTLRHADYRLGIERVGQEGRDRRAVAQTKRMCRIEACVTNTRRLFDRGSAGWTKNPWPSGR